MLEKNENWHSIAHQGLATGETVVTSIEGLTGDINVVGKNQITISTVDPNELDIGHSNSGVTANTYSYMTGTVDVQGHVTAASSNTPVTSLDGITGAVTLVAGTNITITNNSPAAGQIKIDATGAGGVTTVTVTAPITNSGTVTAPNIGHADSAVTPGTYDSVTVDQKGHVTAGTNPSRVATVTTTSPVTNTGTATNPVIDLLTSGATAGTYTNATVTVTAKGIVTAASSGTAPVTSVGVSAPITSTGGATPTIGLSATTTNDGGTVVKQASTPGTQQTGHANISGRGIFGSGVTATSTTTTDAITVSNTSATAGSAINASSSQGYALQISNSNSKPQMYWQLGGVAGAPGAPAYPAGAMYMDSSFNLFVSPGYLSWKQIAYIGKGTSFPTSPDTNDQFYRTDRGILYYYDGTRWLSIHTGTMTLTWSSTAFNSPWSASQSDALNSDSPEATYGLYLTKANFQFIVNTTFDVSNNWTVTLTRTNQSADNTVATIPTYLAGTRTAAGTRYAVEQNINTALLASDMYKIRADLTKNNAPGTLVLRMVIVNYRLIG